MVKSTRTAYQKSPFSSSHSSSNDLTVFNHPNTNPPTNPSFRYESPIPTECQDELAPDIKKQIAQKALEESLENQLNQTHKINEKEIRLISLKTDKGNQVKGAHSFLCTIDENSDQVYEDRPNSSLVIKLPKGSIKMYENSFIQYNKLQNEKFPIVPILNRETYKKNGFLVQEKITPFSKAPWMPSDSLEKILGSLRVASQLNQMIEIFKKTLLDTENPGIDLRWNNFTDEQTLRLFDFYEEDSEFYQFFDHALFLISGKNLEVFDYILKRLEEGNLWKEFEEKIQCPFISNAVEGRIQSARNSLIKATGSSSSQK